MFFLKYEITMCHPISQRFNFQYKIQYQHFDFVLNSIHFLSGTLEDLRFIIILEHFIGYFLELNFDLNDDCMPKFELKAHRYCLKFSFRKTSYLHEITLR